MSGSRFPEEIVEANGERVLAAKITCSGCGAHGFYPNKRGGARRPPEAIAEHFRKQGWELKGRFRCPECARHRPRESEKGFKVKKSMQKTPPNVVTDVVVSPGPLQMPAYEDRQVINLKLIEVYHNAEVGYRDGWTDARVAGELGCPKEWVSSVRDAVFGPEGVNRHIEACRAEIEGVRKQFAELGGEQAEVFRTVGRMRGEMEKLCADLRERFAALDVSLKAMGAKYGSILGEGGQ